LTKQKKFLIIPELLRRIAMGAEFISREEALQAAGTQEELNRWKRHRFSLGLGVRLTSGAKIFQDPVDQNLFLLTGQSHEILASRQALSAGQRGI
jgi:hypothetical protein